MLGFHRPPFCPYLHNYHKLDNSTAVLHTREPGPNFAPVLTSYTASSSIRCGVAIGADTLLTIDLKGPKLNERITTLFFTVYVLKMGLRHGGVELDSIPGAENRPENPKGRLMKWFSCPLKNRMP